MGKMVKMYIESQPTKDTVHEVAERMRAYSRDLTDAVVEGNIGEIGIITREIMEIREVIDELDAFMNPTEPSGPNVL